MSEINRLISIDIEPGGRTKPVGTIGIAEIGDTQILSDFLMRFRSPLFKGSQSHLDHPSFAESWQYLDAFIDESTLTSYGYGYDMKALKALLQADGFDVPDYTFLDGKTTLNRVRKQIGDLQTVASELLFTDNEIKQKKAIWKLNPEKYDKVILHNAQDDAVANAMIFTEVIFPETGTNCSTILSYPQVALKSLKTRASSIHS